MEKTTGYLKWYLYQIPIDISLTSCRFTPVSSSINSLALSLSDLGFTVVFSCCFCPRHRRLPYLCNSRSRGFNNKDGDSRSGSCLRLFVHVCVGSWPSGVDRFFLPKVPRGCILPLWAMIPRFAWPVSFYELGGTHVVSLLPSLIMLDLRYKRLLEIICNLPLLGRNFIDIDNFSS